MKHASQRFLVGLTDLFREKPAASLFAIYLVGSVFLPISTFGNLVEQSDAFVQVLGNALPYGSWWNRAVLLGPMVLILAILRTWLIGTRATLSWPDWMMLMWVLVPVLTGFANDSPLTSDIWQSVYLALTWGAPFAAVRLTVRGKQEIPAALRIIVTVGVITAVLALMEFAFGRFFYAGIYGWHPFKDQGLTRYFGHRPLLFFEDPNQIGMWWATLAIAAWTVWRRSRNTVARGWLMLAVATPFFFQAIGASLLTVGGLGILQIGRRRVIASILIALFLLAVCLIVIRGPLLRYGRQFSESTYAGQIAKSILRNSSMGSFGWRMVLEERNEHLLRQRIAFGWGDVNYWRQDQISERPWGLATLVVGAYGIVGLCVWGVMTVVPCAIVFARGTGRYSADDLPLRALTVILLIHGVDASLNSAYFLPIIMCLGMVCSELEIPARPADDFRLLG